jgi:glutaredoxin
MPLKVTIYSKSGCHLCEIAEERILNVRKRIPFEVEYIDIEGSEDLMRRYGERIPVVCIDGEEVFVYRVSEKLLEKQLRKSHR